MSDTLEDVTERVRPHGIATLFARDGVVRSTLRGILAPRRALAIGVVVVSLTIIQEAYSRPGRFATGTALLMCGSFLLVGPALWRALFPMDGKSVWATAPALVRVLVYAMVGAGLVVGIGRILPGLFGLRATFIGSTPSLAVCVALFWVGGWGLARDVELEEHLRRERARAEALERDAQHAQLLALRSHLDPHFLFNTLNAIAEWCREDGGVAERAILQLSSMLRTMMTGITAAAWPLAREVELVDALFALHAIRDPSLLLVRRDVPDPVPDVFVPPMILLPIAENAMKHGPLARHRGEVRFAVEARGGHIVVEIENPGGYAGPRAGGSGLPIVERRLALTYGERASFTISAVSAERTLARIAFPVEHA